MASGLSIYEISNNPTMYAYSVVITFVFLIIALLLTLKLVPLYRVKAVNGHSDQQFFMLSWMIVNIAYLLFNSAAAEDPVFHMGMVENQIVAPCVILIGTYIILLFAIRTGELIGYKEKNAELELTVSKEQEYRSSFTKDALLTYEFNLTRNFITSGFENAKDDLGDMIYRYSDMLSYRTRRYIHPDDMQDFARFASPSNITKEFERGKSEITIEYRRLESENNYIWCRAVTNLARDSENGDIRGFTYVKDIDAEKRCQIELQYKAERDSLTGLYNKGITGKLIAEHLLFNHSHTASAFFMIDIDNFKDINDHFGHAYGDMVLCELSKKLLRIFRPDDIVGRIGGDEYIVYMKNGATDAVVREKGKKICDAFLSSYQDMYGQKYVLSSSVGVAVSPKDGTTFEELYTHADTALYAAKNDGKNCCQIYNGENFSGYQSDRT
ncbi:MAG: GGDEF domain-containing protein [Oscillospiraceae bacterium]